MPNLATWIRPCDEVWFRRAFGAHQDVVFWNAAERAVPLEQMDGLLLTGGPDIAPEFLHQDVPDPSILDVDADSTRDRWEIDATLEAVARELPVLAICKGLQVFNVALGGTLRLDIPGHNAPEMREADVQVLRTDNNAAHRFNAVNSSHHQAIDRVADGCAIEAWCADDGIIEQVRLTNHRFALAVQFHPERGNLEMYAPLFADFVSHLK